MSKDSSKRHMIDIPEEVRRKLEAKLEETEGRNDRRPWQEWEVDLIAENKWRLKIKELAEILDRSFSSVANKMSQLPKQKIDKKP